LENYLLVALLYRLQFTKAVTRISLREACEYVQFQSRFVSRLPQALSLMVCWVRLNDAVGDDVRDWLLRPFRAKNKRDTVDFPAHLAGFRYKVETKYVFLEPPGPQGIPSDRFASSISPT
jgi:hypothetical protein